MVTQGASYFRCDSSRPTSWCNADGSRPTSGRSGRLMRVWCGRKFAECRIDFNPSPSEHGVSARKGTIGLSEGRLLRRDIAKHNMLCLSDVDAPPVTGLAETLWREQNVRWPFPTPGARVIDRAPAFRKAPMKAPSLMRGCNLARRRLCLIVHSGRGVTSSSVGTPASKEVGFPCGWMRWEPK